MDMSDEQTKAISWKVFEKWLKNLKKAWETKDPQAAAALCSEDNLKYYEDPFQPPLTTKAQVKEIWQEVPKGQKDINIEYEIILTTPYEGIAHWRANYVSLTQVRPVELDGIFIVKLNKQGLCTEFRQWWVEKQ